MLRILVLNLESRSPKIYDSSNRRPLEVKWRRLDSTLLLNSALKFITLCWQTPAFTPRIATMKMAILRIAKVRSIHLRADCHRSNPFAGFILGLRAGVGKPQYDGELIAKQLFLLWQSAELERGV
jgi:hypothetical protein